MRFNRVKGGVELRCRWCKRRPMPTDFLRIHEPLCLAERRRAVSDKLTAAAGRLRHADPKRWRELPGRGWGALGGSHYAVVEIVPTRGRR